MQIHHLLGALLIVCGTVTAADNPGWQNARTPQAGGKTGQTPGSAPAGGPRQPHNSQAPCRHLPLLLFKKPHHWIPPECR